jgi:diadenosine tetraphosphatase ApaH/serine/threonine PP2A family protein phosphatase
VEGFNYLARQAIEWTASALTRENRAWLAALPKGPLVVEPLLEICHGAPFDEDCYIFDDLDATRALRAARAPLCLYGHTHVPAAFRLEMKGRNGDLQMLGPPRRPQFRLSIESEGRYLVNCGAVGQPRDGDPHAAYGMLDTAARTLTIMRVPYDVATAQSKIIAAGLPEVLAQRLSVGR